MSKEFLEAFTTAEQIKSFLDWEKGLREEIAKEIEDLKCDSGTCTDDRRGIECLKKNALLDLAASIIRGNNE